MKNTLLALLITAASGCFAQVKITASAADNPVPQASAMLEVESATRGLLFPRITTAERNAIASPANGLSIFNTTTSCMEYYDGSIWRGLCYADGSGAVTTLDCAGGAQTGTFQANVLSAGTKVISYTGGSGSYGPISVASTGVTGLTASASAGTFSASGTITLAISGTPSSTGTAAFNLTLGGQACTFTVNVPSYMYGGAGLEDRTSIAKTADGGYIMVSVTDSSVSGDVTGTNHGGNDWWVVKLNATGAITWQRLYGGAGNDNYPYIVQVPDGGYIIGGHTTSSASGDVTGTNKGAYDFWILKIDASGNKLWDKIYGGINNEFAYTMTPTAEGGIILAGSSQSPVNTGDVTGGNATFTTENMWLLKLDANGNKLLSTLYSGGGGGSDRIFSIKQTPDGGYILAGNIVAPGGNITAASKGGADYVILKLDSTGAITWQKRYGGSANDAPTSVEQTTDGGYIVGGSTSSPVSGDVTIASKGGGDIWILKLNSAGAITWQKRFGGSGADAMNAIIQTSDGGYIIGGATNSPASGDVSTATNGGLDYWIIKLDASGNIVWNKVYGGVAHEYPYSIMQTSNGSYMVAGFSISSQSGNVTQINHSSDQDVWLLQLDASGNIVPLTGH